LINPPQTAILALGRIIPKPVVMDGEIVIRKMAWISMTCDHRIINGVQAAMFSRSLTEMINNPIQI
jgi:pyruvate/2-oxoglutarate dehydrogenase complex dihydrolipoamide acyltransferase (E2) component